MLTEMDGFEENSGVIVMAATNLPEVLDPALTRPGRFDRLVTVNVPDVRGRQVRCACGMLRLEHGPDTCAFVGFVRPPVQNNSPPRYSSAGLPHTPRLLSSLRALLTAACIDAGSASVVRSCRPCTAQFAGRFSVRMSSN
jgi:hypothetical protein